MRVIIQRVSQASVTIDHLEKSRIGPGLLVLLGIEDRDREEDIDWLIKKIAQMRIFNDEQNHMNLSLLDVQGELMVVSQFTLHASTKKGNRPSFIKAAKPEASRPLYEMFLRKASELLQKPVASGSFGAMMEVRLINDGPVTISMDSHQRE